jgi:hypothetical protein
MRNKECMSICRADPRSGFPNICVAAVLSTGSGQRVACAPWQCLAQVALSFREEWPSRPRLMSPTKSLMILTERCMLSHRPAATLIGDHSRTGCDPVARQLRPPGRYILVKSHPKISVSPSSIPGCQDCRPSQLVQGPHLKSRNPCAPGDRR